MISLFSKVKEEICDGDTIIVFIIITTLLSDVKVVRFLWLIGSMC